MKRAGGFEGRVSDESGTNHSPPGGLGGRAEAEAPPGHLLVWDFLSPIQKWIIKQNPRVRDGLQLCGLPVSNSKTK